MSYADYLRPNGWGYEPGKTIVVIGPSYGGPSNVPMEVRANPAALFGGGPLADSLDVGLKLAADMRWIGIRLNGISGRASIPALVDQDDATLVFESVAGTDMFNNEEIHINRDEYGLLTLQMPGGVMYRLSDYSHLAALIEAINRDALYGRSPFWVYSSVNDLPTHRLGELVGTYEITGGDREANLSKDDLFLKLSDVLTLIDGRQADAVVLAGLYFDDRHDQAIYGSDAYGEAVYGNDTDYLTLQDSARGMMAVSYHSLLAEWCSKQAARGRIVAGFISTRPLANSNALLDIQDEYALMLVEHAEFQSRAGLYDAYGQETGRFIHISCGQGDLNGEAITLEIPTAVRYLRNVIDSSTNAPIGVKLVWELDAPQRIKLAEYGVISFYTDPRATARIWSGVTAAPSHSDWHWSVNLRQVQLVVAACLDQLDNYVGGDFRSVYLSKRIDRDIQSVLNSFRSTGVVSEYTFSVEYIPLKKEVRLDLSLLAKHGIEVMRTIGQVTMG